MDAIKELRELKAAYEREGTQFGATMALWCQVEIDLLCAIRRARIRRSCIACKKSGVSSVSL